MRLRPVFPAVLAAALALAPVAFAQGEPGQKDLAVQLQTELKRVGCYSKFIDGDWGISSKRALERFAKASGVELPSVASAEALEVVKAAVGVVCEPIAVQKKNFGLHRPRGPK